MACRGGPAGDDGNRRGPAQPAPAGPPTHTSRGEASDAGRVHRHSPLRNLFELFSSSSRAAIPMATLPCPLPGRPRRPATTVCPRGLVRPPLTPGSTRGIQTLTRRSPPGTMTASPCPSCRFRVQRTRVTSAHRLVSAAGGRGCRLGTPPRPLTTPSLPGGTSGLCSRRAGRCETSGAQTRPGPRDSANGAPARDPASRKWRRGCHSAPHGRVPDTGHAGPAPRGLGAGPPGGFALPWPALTAPHRLPGLCSVRELEEELAYQGCTANVTVTRCEGVCASWTR